MRILKYISLLFACLANSEEEATLTGSFFVFTHNTTTHIRGLLYYIEITFFIFFIFYSVFWVSMCCCVLLLFNYLIFNIFI